MYLFIYYKNVLNAVGVGIMQPTVNGTASSFGSLLFVFCVCAAHLII